MMFSEKFRMTLVRHDLRVMFDSEERKKKWGHAFCFVDDLSYT